MDKGLDKKLVERFPVLYQDRYSPMTDTCMCWGFDCGDGWFNIIWMLSLAIEEELGYSYLQKDWYLTKKRWARRWNKLVYWISPVQRDRYATTGKGTKEDPIRNVLVEKAKGDWICRLANRFPEQSYKSKGLRKALWRWQSAGLKSLRWDPFTGLAVQQVKEKYGTLRFYCGGNDHIYGLISLAERLSAVTCEVCGAHGETRGGGWIQTLCEAHAKKEVKQDA